MINIKVGQGSCGISAGAGKVYTALEQILNNNPEVQLSVTGCIGMCYLEPIVDIYTDEELIRLVRVKDSDAQAIADYISTADKSFIKNLIVSVRTSIFLILRHVSHFAVAVL